MSEDMRWIQAHEIVVPATRKTKQWEIHAKNGGGVLGFVEWLTRWRRYTFRPTTAYSTWFEQDCLRDIAAFVERETAAHKNAPTPAPEARET